MQYFELKKSEHVKNVIVPILQEITMPIINVDALEDYSIGYYERKGIETTDLLTAPLFMVSEEIKELMRLYDESILFKGIQLFSKDSEYVPALYYAVCPFRADCLHKDVRINPNGTVNEVVLDKTRIPKRDIFQIDGLVQQKIVVSLRVAVSLLRRSLYGIGLKEIQVR